MEQAGSVVVLSCGYCEEALGYGNTSGLMCGHFMHSRYRRARDIVVKDKLRRTPRKSRNANNTMENMDIPDACFIADAPDFSETFDRSIDFETLNEINYTEMFEEIPDSKKFYPDSPYTTFDALSKLNGLFLYVLTY